MKVIQRESWGISIYDFENEIQIGAGSKVTVEEYLGRELTEMERFDEEYHDCIFVD